MMVKNQYKFYGADDYKKIKTSLISATKVYQKEGFAWKNKQFSDALQILMIDSEFHTEIKKKAEALHFLLCKVLSVYSQCAETREFFMLNDQQMKLAEIDCGYEKGIRINRFDGIVAKESGEIKIIENNADCPAGILFTSRLMNLMERIQPLKEQLKKNKSKSLLQNTYAFCFEFLSIYQEFCDGIEKIPRIAILQLKGQENIESKEMVKVLSSLGIQSYIADPGELIYKNSVLCYKGKKIDFIWNKINSVYFDKIIDNFIMGNFIQACKDKAVCHVNSFASRYIIESKLCAAYLHSDLFKQHIGPEEKTLIREVIPWSQKLDLKNISYNGETTTAFSLGKKFKDQLVLKQAYDIRGDGVVIGRSTSKEEWNMLLEEALEKPYILQEFIEPSDAEVQLIDEDLPKRRMFSLDMFMFGGILQGFGSKASLEDKLNIFQGGSKVAVFSRNGVLA